MASLGHQQPANTYPIVLVLVCVLQLSHLAACCQQQCCLSKGIANAEGVDGAELLHPPHHAVHSNRLVLIAVLAVGFLSVDTHKHTSTQAPHLMAR